MPDDSHTPAVEAIELSPSAFIAAIIDELRALLSLRKMWREGMESPSERQIAIYHERYKVWKMNTKPLIQVAYARGIDASGLDHFVTLGESPDDWTWSAKALDCLRRIQASIDFPNKESTASVDSPLPATSERLGQTLTQVEKIQRAGQYLTNNPRATKAEVEQYAGWGKGYLSRDNGAILWQRLQSGIAGTPRKGFKDVSGRVDATDE